MGTQLNALPALPVRARTVSGCLNSALLGLERNRPAVVTSQLPGEPASALLCSCFATESLAQTAPLSRATNLHIKANRVPPCGCVQEPVPERPQTLAVKPSSACAGPSGTGFFLFPTARPSSTAEMWHRGRRVGNEADPGQMVLFPTRLEMILATRSGRQVSQAREMSAGWLTGFEPAISRSTIWCLNR